MKRTLVLMASALALTACATDPITGESIYGNTGRGAAIGAIVGGLCVKQWSLLRVLLVFGVLQIASNAGYIILAQTGKSLDVFKAVVVVESFCNGLVSAAFVAYFMMLCLPRFAAAQYALLSGLMFLASAIVGASSGWLVERLGYQSFFMISIVVGIPPLLALPWAMPRAGDDDAALSND